MHFQSQCSSLVVRSPGGCLLFFCLGRSTQGGVQFPRQGSSHSTSFGLLCLFVTLISKVSSSSAEHAEVIVEAPFSLIGGELTSLAVRSGHIELDAGLLASLEEPGVLADEVVLPDLDFSCPDLDELPPELKGLGDKVDWDLEEQASSSLCSQ